MVVRELLIGLGFSLDESKLKRADQGIANIKDRATAAIGVLGRMAAVVGLALGAGEVVKIGDEWTNVNSRIGLVTKSAEEQADMQQKVFDIAQKTRQEYAATGDLYYKMARSSDQLGASQQDILDVTETVNKALVVGGAGTAQAQATILQLSQALSSGRLQGDELRSLGENASVLMDEVAKYYGVTVGKLKQMGADGELTAEGVFKAILKAKAKMDREFERMPVTIEQSVTYALNRIGSLIFGLNKETSVFQHIARGIMKAADGIATVLEKGIKLVGGWANAFKLATIALASFGVAFVIFREGLFTLEMWRIALGVLRIGVVNLAKSFLSFLLNPAFLTIAAITLGIMALVLVVEDLYYWITGGESVLGDWLGSWDDFKIKVSAWISQLVDQLIGYWDDLKTGWLSTWQSIIDIMLRGLKFWKQVFTGDISGAIETAKEHFTGLGEKAMSVFQKIKDNAPTFNGGAGGMGSYGVGAAGMASIGGGSTVVVHYTSDTHIEQNMAGTGQQVAAQVGEKTAEAAGSSNDKLARDLQYLIPGGD
jgi:tape measure domain-containing protein